MAANTPSMRNMLLRPSEGPDRFGGVTSPGSDVIPSGTPRLPANALRMPPVAPAGNPLAAPVVQQPIQPGVQEPRRDPAGIEDRVSTRIPTSKRLSFDPHSVNDLTIGRGAMIPEGLGPHRVASEHFGKARNNISEAMANTAKQIRSDYPHISTEGLDDAGTLERFIEHAHDNVVSLWNRVRDRPWRDAAVDWYKGANRIARDLSRTHGGISHRQAAAVVAALSPQQDWDQNVNLAERVLNTHKHHQETAVTPEMHAFMQGMIDARHPSRRAALELLVHGGTGKKTGIEYAPITVGTRLRDLPHPEQQALFVRAHDESHNPDRSFQVVSPTGERTPAGRRVTWGGLNEITNAMRALREDSRPNISRSLGGMHKVRNFYNNIIAPDAAAFIPHGHDVTADTHAINVSLMRPMGGGHPAVAQGLGSAGFGSAFSGTNGLYGLHADAIRRAAETISRQEGRRYLPREVQSVTWEAVRNLFRKEHKAIDEHAEPTHPVGRTARDAWHAVRHGFMPAEMARQAIIDAAGGIRDPAWHSGAR